jgi:hypothetical protein
MKHEEPVDAILEDFSQHMKVSESVNNMFHHNNVINHTVSNPNMKHLVNSFGIAHSEPYVGPLLKYNSETRQQQTSCQQGILLISK